MNRLFRIFVGALVDNHLDGQSYDAERFWPVFEKAQHLNVPIYLLLLLLLSIVLPPLM
jgi:predicted TIM-barrel fold metal-dependent hydrolase